MIIEVPDFSSLLCAKEVSSSLHETWEGVGFTAAAFIGCFIFKISVIRYHLNGVRAPILGLQGIQDLQGLHRVRVYLEFSRRQPYIEQ